MLKHITGSCEMLVFKSQGGGGGGGGERALVLRCMYMGEHSLFFFFFFFFFFSFSFAVGWEMERNFSVLPQFNYMYM